MKKVTKSTQFKKDFKRIIHDKEKVQSLFDTVQKLANGETLPPEMKPHQLSGNYKNHMECHIGSDYLLIWFDKVTDEIKLVRLGTHSELFK